MMDTWRTDWAKKKANVATALDSGQCGGSYGDAAVILCSCLSALAAEVWPGTGIDQDRFVELLAKYAPPQLGSARVSVPLLADHLRSHNHIPEATKIESTFLRQFNSGQILTGDQVDKNETEIRAACSISLKHVRRFSYANLLYREVRCAYTHKGKIGQAAESSPQTGFATRISYFNWSG